VSVKLTLQCLLAAGLINTWTYAAELVPLGDEKRCQQYSGLPRHWRQDTHAGMTFINGGTFTLGTQLGYPEERPEVKTSVAGFWIDQTEVTVAQFADFVKATNYVTEAEREGGGAVFRVPTQQELSEKTYAWWSYVSGASWRHPKGAESSARLNQPVTLVTLNDALAYAHWLGRDLPTEAEWEYAAKAGGGSELEKEPRTLQGKPAANFWQGEFPIHNTREDGHEGLAAVGCYAANRFNVYDMVGNVWEQTKDSYTPVHQQAGQLEVSAPANRAMVIKGGSHLCARDFCVRYRPSSREAHEANLAISHIGFRTVTR